MPLLEEAGLVFSGVTRPRRSREGLIEAVELPGHPFFIGCSPTRAALAAAASQPAVPQLRVGRPQAGGRRRSLTRRPLVIGLAEVPAQARPPSQLPWSRQVPSRQSSCRRTPTTGPTDLPFEQRELINYDEPAAFDTRLLREHLLALMRSSISSGPCTTSATTSAQLRPSRAEPGDHRA